MYEPGLAFGRVPPNLCFLLEVTSLAVARRIVWVDLGLRPGLDHIQWAGHDSGNAASRDGRQYLEFQSNLMAAHPFFGYSLFLFVEGKLQGREGKVAKDGSFVAGIECSKALGSGDGLCRVPRRPVIVPGVEEWVVVSTLEL
jgi:hypothetical protein